jgi:uncharacterized protein YkwD
MRRLRALATAAGGVLLLAAPAARAAHPATLDAAVLAEVNFARMHPAQYARELEHAARRGGPQGYSEIGNEQGEAVSEAIGFLLRQRPLPALKASQNLTLAARAHAYAQAWTGEVGHVSPNGAGLSERLHAHGVWAGLAAEDISYGYHDPAEVVRQLIVDSRVPNRGHRQNIFGAHYQAAGVACAPHREYGAMCVIDFAGALVRR